MIELQADGKRPVREWTEFRQRLVTPGEIESWSDNANIGIATGRQSGIAVVDCESRQDAEWFWRNRGRTSTVVQTRRGYHFYFKWQEGIGNAARVRDENGVPRYDIRGEGGYVVAPPSVIDGHKYAYKLHLSNKLPLFLTEWLPKPVQTRTGVVNGRAYISRIQAVAGQGGHNDTYRAACVLRRAGLLEAEALAAMVEWNQTNADPPWTTAELLHKVKDAYS